MNYSLNHCLINPPHTLKVGKKIHKKVLLLCGVVGFKESS